jgi:redox-sensing transcriptional repressor
MLKGQLRISSAELAKLMNVTASQIRQDLNCFGGFGQQGYGYNISYLYAKISELLGVGEGYRCIIVGAGNLGRALVNSRMFEKRGVDIVAMFDVNPEIIGKEFGGATVYSMDALEDFCKGTEIDIAVITVSRDAVNEAMESLINAGVKGFWNFTSTEINIDDRDVVCENIHMGDSLMTLCYNLRSKRNTNKEQ